ncbi:MAG: hypothetical protein RKE49_15560 [Oceanicaulis sp.]
MAEFSFAKAFQPGGRSAPRTFQIALALVALGDAVRLTLLGAFAGPAWLVVLLFLAFALSNRLRDAGRSNALALLPLGAAIAAKAVVAIGAVLFEAFPDAVAFFESQGVDVEDPAELQAAANDPELQAAYQAHVMDSPELMAQIQTAGDWPSTWAFWGVIALFALAWSKWPGRPYAVGGRR